MRLPLFRKWFLVLGLSALLAGCAIYEQAPTPTANSNFAYVSVASNSAVLFNTPGPFKPIYSLIIVAVDNHPQPTQLLGAIYTLDPGKHTITIACAVLTPKNKVLGKGYNPSQFRTFNLTALANVNYVFDYDFPSTSAYTVYDNPCAYAVLHSSP